MRSALLVLAACSSSPQHPPSNAAAAPTGPVTFRRDFSKAGTWTYDFKQTMTTTSMAHDEVSDAVGKVTLASNLDKTAKLTMEATLTARGEKPEVAPPITTTLREDGAGPADDPAAAMLAVMFPLPTKPLAVGQTDSVPFSLPMRGVVASNVVSGPLVLTYVADTPRCAQFEGKIRIEEAGELSTAKFTLDGTWCLDRNDGSLVTSRLTMEMVIAMKQGPGGLKMAGTAALDRK